MLYVQKDVEKLGRIIGIWAHPDDESWSSAGLMKMACLNGQNVAIITATKGDAGLTADEQKWPQRELSAIREKELSECLCHIGDIEQFWLDYEDGKLAESDSQEAIAEIVRILNVFKPDTIVTFEPNGITGHDDHRTISDWTTLALQQYGKKIRLLHAVESVEKHKLAGDDLDQEFNIFFNTEKPYLIAENEADILLQLSSEILACKLSCLKAHASQTSQMFTAASSKNALQLLASTECFIVVPE
jgi:LmbE family N-acetylglucosaminyl deacetylase